MGKTITQIGRYEISRQLVDTALASVYDAFDPVERKPVAIRVPRTTQTHGIGPLSVGMKHPGLMNVLKYEENKGETFLVLEPFEGKPLDLHVPAGQKMAAEDAMDMLRQLASALDYAHSFGYVHGSLHPAGILLNDKRQVKVLDLGPSDPPAGNATAEQLLHAVHYLAPECVRDRPMDGRSDQFSLAVLAHQVLTGVLPFAGSPLGAMFRIAYQGLERDAIRDLPQAAQVVFQRALAKSPAERYGTCTEMVNALESALIRRPVAATRVADASEFAAMPAVAPLGGRPAEKPRRSREALKYFGITFVAVAVVLAAVFYFLLPPKPAQNPTVAVPGLTNPAVPPGAPAAQTAPVPTPEPATTPAAKGPAAKSAKPPSKGHAKKKTEPEVELKPVEPKIIRP